MKNCIVNASCRKIEENAVVYEQDGEIKKITCDSVVIAVGAKTTPHLHITEVCEKRNIPVHEIGDAVKVRRALDSIAEGVETGYIHETTSEMFDKDISINFKGVFLFTKYALPELRKNERSTVVNFSAVSAAMGMVGHSIYGAAKYAIESFTRMIATQYGKEGVRANCIRPGVMVNPVWADTDFGKEYAAFMLSHLPSTRIGTAKDAAPVVLFFASDDSFYVTGQTLTMDGGLTCHEPQWKEDLENFEKGLR